MIGTGTTMPAFEIFEKNISCNFSYYSRESCTDCFYCIVVEEIIIFFNLSIIFM